jgi:hypothetical protein
LSLGPRLGVVVILGFIVGVGAAGGGEEAEGAGERVLEESAPCPGRRSSPGSRGGGAAKAEGCGQVLGHVARVGHGDADRHRGRARVIRGRETLLETAAHSDRGPGGGRAPGVLEI